MPKLIVDPLDHVKTAFQVRKLSYKENETEAISYVADFYCPFGTKLKKNKIFLKMIFKSEHMEHNLNQIESLIQNTIKDYFKERDNNENMIDTDSFTFVRSYRTENPKFKQVMKIHQKYRGTKCLTKVYKNGAPWSLGYLDNNEKFSGKICFKLLWVWFDFDKKYYGTSWIAESIFL